MLYTSIRGTREYPLQHCPDLRHVAVQTRSGDHRARSKRTEPGCFGRRSGRCGTEWGVASLPPLSLPLDTRCHTGGGEFPSPFRAAVATLCPFLLPPIRRHRSVIRNCVSLSSPYPIYGYIRTYERSYAFLRISFLSSPSRFSLGLSLLRSSAPPLRLSPSLSVCFLSATP